MGNDGGSIPRRSEVVKTKQRGQNQSSSLLAKAKARLCAMSKEPLRQPIAFCRLGHLYNREEILRRMLEKSVPKAFRHIRKIRDVRAINPKCARVEEDGGVMLTCPITQNDFTGYNNFIAVWGCGCVISEEANKMLKMDEKCISCGEVIEKKEDIISLNQTPDQ